MIVLRSTDTLEVSLGSAKASLDNPVTAHYTDIDTTSGEADAPDRQLSNTNGTSIVTVCDAPASGKRRMIKKLTLAVEDTAGITVKLRIYNGSTRFTILPLTSFAVGDLLQDDGE